MSHSSNSTTMLQKQNISMLSGCETERFNNPESNSIQTAKPEPNILYVVVVAMTINARIFYRDSSKLFREIDNAFQNHLDHIKKRKGIIWIYLIGMYKGSRKLLTHLTPFRDFITEYCKEVDLVIEYIFLPTYCSDNLFETYECFLYYKHAEKIAAVHKYAQRPTPNSFFLVLYNCMFHPIPLKESYHTQENIMVLYLALLSRNYKDAVVIIGFFQEFDPNIFNDIDYQPKNKREPRLITNFLEKIGFIMNLDRCYSSPYVCFYDSNSIRTTFFLNTTAIREHILGTDLSNVFINSFSCIIINRPKRCPQNMILKHLVDIPGCRKVRFYIENCWRFYNAHKIKKSNLSSPEILDISSSIITNIHTHHLLSLLKNTKYLILRDISVNSFIILIGNIFNSINDLLNYPPNNLKEDIKTLNNNWKKFSYVPVDPALPILSIFPEIQNLNNILYHMKNSLFLKRTNELENKNDEKKNNEKKNDEKKNDEKFDVIVFLTEEISSLFTITRKKTNSSHSKPNLKKPCSTVTSCTLSKPAEDAQQTLFNAEPSVSSSSEVVKKCLIQMLSARKSTLQNPLQSSPLDLSMSKSLKSNTEDTCANPPSKYNSPTLKRFKSNDNYRSTCSSALNPNHSLVDVTKQKKTEQKNISSSSFPSSSSTNSSNSNFETSASTNKFFKENPDKKELFENIYTQLFSE
ncbi:hypothetical protein NEFER03_0972 [Nematocida sp. LUAm3]|nr:hypothetical protein NEFER03_0972 [Nematocida sp. LUAm3]KAI5175424.1 hypothetical protein NEFER02_1353 [Nematocida sp. LUAm2]KAI5177619.1 hypothetical protein NEFER01_0843 [Nematocida sp. LUAm1]